MNGYDDNDNYFAGEIRVDGNGYLCTGWYSEDGYWRYYSEEDYFLCTSEIIEDNGKGMPQDMLKCYNDREEAIKDEGRSIGLHNAFSRMNMYYGAKASWNVSSMEGMGTVITLRLPVL